MKKIDVLYARDIDEAVVMAKARKEYFKVMGIETLITIDETNLTLKWRVEVWGAIL